MNTQWKPLLNYSDKKTFKINFSSTLRNVFQENHSKDYIIKTIVKTIFTINTM